MKIALTGASGYAGGRVLARLLARGESVRALVREGSLATASTSDRVEIVRGVLGSADDAQRLSRRVASGETEVTSPFLRLSA